jgi:hypothetical protein
VHRIAAPRAEAAKSSADKIEEISMELNIRPILISSTGSARYGYNLKKSDQDFMILAEMEDRYINDKETGIDYFVVSLTTFRNFWGHPLRLADLVNDCTGNERLCAFLKKHRWEIPYAAPGRTALYGLEYIAQGENSGFDSTIKPSLRTAIVLDHMSKRADNPFLLSEEEKIILTRARTGGVPPEERVEIYRRTISPENINRLLKMPDHPTIKNELFQLIDDIISKEEFAC